MRHLRFAGVALASLSLVSIPACGGRGDGTAAQRPPGEIRAKDFDPALFDDSSATIDNAWVPFRVGRRFVWKGWSMQGGERERHRDVFTVTDMTKVIAGVRGIVGWDRDYSAGKLVEAELIVLAQDRYGNVWHLGQSSEAYEDGELSGQSTWFAGALKGARAGIYIKARLRLHTPAYSQGFAPAPYFWNDWSKVYRKDVRTCVPTGCYRHVVVVDEFEPRKPGAHQLKYYARGVGNVRIGWRGSDPEKEVMVLSKVVQLDRRAMAAARRAVRRHEARAYVYAKTPRAERRG